jgi:NAD(P)-dependent dehydrogenase (short-subunit alcohol dehydrogenase family)
MDDINQEFSKAFYPAFTRYGESEVICFFALHPNEKYVAYSKLAVIIWSKELQRRLDSEASPIIVSSVHPGVANTSKDKMPFWLRPFGGLLMKLLFVGPDKGCYTSVIAAASPDVREKAEAYKGAYLAPVGKLTTPSKIARNINLGHELWQTTETFLTRIGLK